MKTFIVPSSWIGRRLDEALFGLGEYLSRSKAQAAIKKGLVLVNGKAEKAHYPLEEGDEIRIEKEEVAPSSIIGEDIPLDIVYEDEDILILNKQRGLVVHPGNGNPTGTLLHALAFHGKKLGGGEENRPGIVHRIDKDTSGLLAIAKNEEAFASLSKQLSDHSMNRKYKALVLGNIYEDEGKIDAPIGRDPKNPMRYCVSLKGKESVTYFNVLERFANRKATLVACRLLTGRTHQIRVHMDYIGHPILGDPLYGKGNRKDFDEGQLLHAYELTLTHPRTGEKMTFSAPEPKELIEALEKLRAAL